MAVTHKLKSWPEFFRPIVAGERCHELRRNDRAYQVGDIIELNEFDPATQTFTGARCLAKITSLTSSDVPCAVSSEALNPQFCILSIHVTSFTAVNESSGQELTGKSVT
ncbi:DUF3850 domain-containing protein [Mycobacterium paragordonae]|uniref:DUF3850 domain-containing protein n=1 Tax=Mycobacterium paragordonae TaxID=1389713 RepID=UPI00105DF266|nr:DUF3850 domain-containing protein [Mycobacterium paragordonae]TDK99548.1 DUF3850 domain-containing protein [Mycobacterium paragordonae]TDL06100.1 DUF3850 domain-containing protein [Mycobacterium paragordonae]